MTQKVLHIFIVFVWLTNGLYCKVLNQVPRHQEIVSKILSEDYAKEIIFIIGILEIMMAVWIVSKIKSKLNSITQITMILSMNILEFIFAKDLLLFGSLNSVFAICFCAVIYYQEFILKEKRNV
ncbi:DoxX-like family protein [Polaribacter sp.]|uniref:DoxX-like family protein n=1 Tax=Polaribacter sp. TaxID=1920175 RepID=UPI003EF5F6BD